MAARTAVRRRQGGTLARPWLGAAALLLLAAGCASQQEPGALSALHYFQRGNAAYQAEDYPRAITHYRTALTFDAAAPELHYNLGLALYRMGAWREAATALQQAVGLDPGFAEAHRTLALAHDKLYNAPAAHDHYNRYRALAGGPAGAEAGAEGSGGAGRARPTAGSAAAGAMQTGPPAGLPAHATRAGDAKEPAPSNPFEGNRKWWTQDTASQTR